MSYEIRMYKPWNNHELHYSYVFVNEIRIKQILKHLNKFKKPHFWAIKYYESIMDHDKNDDIVLKMREEYKSLSKELQRKIKKFVDLIRI